MRRYQVWLLPGLLILGLSYPGSVWAGATLHIGSGAGTPCAEGGCPLFNGETNNFSVTALDIYQNASGANAASNSVLLILAIPNDTSSGELPSAGETTITSATLYRSYDPNHPFASPQPLLFSFGATSFGLDSHGYHGLMTGGDIYGFLDLKANKSDNMPNLVEWDQLVTVDSADGISADRFGIYTYAFDTKLFTANSLIEVGLTGVPEGTFAVAYGQDPAAPHSVRPSLRPG